MAAGTSERGAAHPTDLAGMCRRHAEPKAKLCVMQCEVKASVSAEADVPWRKADDLNARVRCRESEETTTDGLQSCRVFSPNPAESNGQGTLSSCSIGPSPHPHFTTHAYDQARWQHQP